MIVAFDCRRRVLNWIIPTAYQFVAERLLESQLRTGTADNDINAIKAGGYLPQGLSHYAPFDRRDAFFVQTDVPDGLKSFSPFSHEKGHGR